MKFETVYLTKYSVNKENSTKEERPSRLYPGHSRELALDIQEIAVEAKISDLKKIKMGGEIVFSIKQELVFDSWDTLKKEECDYVTWYETEGIGTVLKSEKNKLNLELDDYDDDEWLEVFLEIDGYSEEK